MRIPRFTVRRLHRERSRGQSLVEFSLVIPILMFLTMIALDFGRVYLGWINLQNMTRIAANFAANNPTAWSGGGDAAVQTQYQNQIKNDATATNCDLPVVSGVRTAPAPTFADTGANGSASDIGDTAYVGITCQFGVITPFVSSILSGSVAVSSSSTFPVKSGMSGSAGAVGGSAPNAAFSGNAAFAPSTLSGTAPFNVVFRDTSGGNPTSWAWDLDGDNSTDSIAQDPLDYLYVVPGTYVVEMTATNSLGSSKTSMGITVTAVSVANFTADDTVGPPRVVTFTDTSAPGGTAFNWDFGAGEGTGTGPTVSHAYTTTGYYTVTLTVTYPIVGDVVETKINYINVDPGLCEVPSLNGVRRNSAQAAWTGASFTGSVSDGPGAPSGNYFIQSQSLTAESDVPCSSSVVVNNR